MKELSIVEKAKAYDEALEKARQLCAYPTTKPFISDLQDLFPELQESEDEKIKEALVDIIEHFLFWKDKGLTKEKVLAWLEKQGKPIDKIVKRAMNEKQRVLLTETNGDANIDWDTRSLQDVKLLLEYGLDYIKKLEKQGEQKPVDKIQLGKKYKCIASPRYSTFMIGEIYKPEDKFLCNLMNFCSDCFKPIEDDEQNLTDKVEPKFKVGDIIRHKKQGFTCKIIAVDNEYKLSGCNGTHLPFEWQDAYELVEQKPYGQRQECADCQFNYAGECRGSCAMKRGEPKFKVGDWVIDKQGIVHQIANVIENVTYHTYGYDIVGGGYFNDNTEGVRLWTIQDAKDGDVLKEDSCTFIIERMKPDRTAITHCCLFDDGDFDLGSTLSFDVDSTYPATKEQRDLLFQKMKEAGYELDADEKELKKVKKAPQKFMVGDTIKYNGTEYKITEITPNGYKVYALTYDEDAASLISFSAPAILVEQKSTWSEEDKRIIDNLISQLGNLFARKLIKEETKDKYVNFLKSLKDRYTWKPSDEQMKALNYVVNLMASSESPAENDYYYNAFKGLREQLKKLSEE